MAKTKPNGADAPAEATVAEKPVYLTEEGLAKLESELDYLRHTRRQQVANRISETTHSGGSTDESEFDDAKNEQAFVEGRIHTIEHLIRNAQIIKHDQTDSGIVQMGSKVTVTSSDGDEMTYVIVGSAEAQPRQGRISNESPVGRALLGRKTGDEVQVLAPAGLVKLKITTIA